MVAWTTRLPGGVERRLSGCCWAPGSRSLLGLYGRVHVPAYGALPSFGFSSTATFKAWVGSVVLVLAATQAVTALCGPYVVFDGGCAGVVHQDVDWGGLQRLGHRRIDQTVAPRAHGVGKRPPGRRARDSRGQSQIVRRSTAATMGGAVHPVIPAKQTLITQSPYVDAAALRGMRGRPLPWSKRPVDRVTFGMQFRR